MTPLQGKDKLLALCRLSLIYNSIYIVYTLCMKTKIQKWGNSLGVRLPKNITDQKTLRDGLGVFVVLRNNQIVIEPIEEELSLESLLSKVTVDNLHKETEWSAVRGKETW